MMRADRRATTALPPGLRRLLTAVIAAGSATVGWAALRATLSTPPAAWRIAVAALLMSLSDVPLLHIRWGHDTYSFTWSEVSVMLTVVLVPEPWAVLVAAAGVLALNGVTGRPLLKTAFNSASTAIGVALAAGTFALGTGPSGTTSLHHVTGWLALIAGTTAYVVWNALSVAAAVGLSQGVATSVILRKGLLLRWMIFAGNTCIGAVVVILALWNRGGLIVLPFAIAILHLLYSGYLRAVQDRDTWRQLQAASRELNQLQWADLTRAVLDRTQALFQAEFVELLLVDLEPTGRADVFRLQAGEADVELTLLLDEAKSFWPRAYAERELFSMSTRKGAPSSQRDELLSHGLEICMVAPLVATDACLGTLRIGFRGPVRFSTRQEQLLSTFTNHVASAVANAQLFHAVHDERSKLSSIVEHSSDGIIAVDAEGRVVSWNPAMVTITGRPAERVLGSSIDLGTDNLGDGRITPDWLREQLASDDKVDASVQVAAITGPPRWLHVSAATARDTSGVADTVVLVAHDITAMREAAESKQDFIATVSHELRTPLTALKGFVHTLLRPDFKPSPEVLRDCHERIQSQTVKLQRLIEDLLSVSGMDRGQFSVERAAVSVDDVVHRAIAELPVSIPHRPIQHIRAGPAGTAYADAGRLEQVVANLLVNADKYSPAGTPVSVVVERVLDEVLISVIDQGPGIPEDSREIVFEPFRRLGNHLTRPVGGSGLGLHIARRLVVAMGGRIWVDATREGGSVFRLALPAAPLAAHSASIGQDRL